MRRLSLPGGRSGQAVVGLAALALIVLVWLGSVAALHANRTEVEAHAAAEIANEALIFADRMSDHLAAIDQTLHILERDWEMNPEGFDLSVWRQRALVLSDASLQVFVAGPDGVIRSATDPALIGQNVGDRQFFRNRAALPSDDGRMYIGPASPRPGGDGWVLNLARRLDLPDGEFAGVITVSYDVAALVRFYRQADLGPQGLIELVGDKDELLRAAAGGGALPGESIANTAMWHAIEHAPDGRWVGPSAPDGVLRIHAFHQLRDRDLDVVLAMSVENALRPAIAWKDEALAIASLTTLLVLVLAVGLLRQANTAQARVTTMARDRAVLAAAKADADAKSARLEVTLAGMSDGVMMMDADLRLVEWNRRFGEMTGLPDSQLVRGVALEVLLRAQAELGEFGPVDVEPEVTRRIAAIRSQPDALTTERERPDGRILAVRRRRLIDGSFVTIYSDVTDRRRDEDALRKARFLAEAMAEAKSRFVAMVSHEIRQPLNALLNSLSLLAGNEMTPAARRLVDMAQQSGDALLGLLNDILEMSKMEAGQLTLRPDVFALRPLLQSVLDMFSEPAAARGITLALAVADGTPERLKADPVRIRQILMNLMSNAVKFALPGRVVLLAETEKGTEGMLRLTIRDPGPTIDPAGRARLFQPFVQLGDGGSGDNVGTGLGLAICQTLAGLLGGEIGYEPTEQNGNAFWVRLAFTQPAEPALARARPRPIYPRSRVLLVEDIRANQLVIATLLRREGHLVDVAASGAAAVRAAAAQPYDLVLMDIFMPGMTGIEATRHIRALPGPAGQVPICALTGNVSPEDRERCEAAGMNDVLGKPVELDALIEVLGRLVWPHRPAREPQGPLEPLVSTPVLPLLMQSRLSELRANLQPSMLADIAEQSVEELTERLPLLRAALASGDDATIEAEAHAMAGLAGSYAMAALEFRMHSIVEAVRSGGARRAAAVAGDLEAQFARSAAALRHAVNTEMAE